MRCTSEVFARSAPARHSVPGRRRWTTEVSAQSVNGIRSEEPAARHDTKSPIYGMPIIDADKAKFVIANKRSMNPGFAGIDNELYSADNTLMIFGDAKSVLGEVVKALTGGGGH